MSKQIAGETSGRLRRNAASAPTGGVARNLFGGGAMQRQWTDEDRAKKRYYYIYVGRRCEARMWADLGSATQAWSAVCDLAASRRVVLYADRRAWENICCVQD